MKPWGAYRIVGYPWDPSLWDYGGSIGLWGTHSVPTRLWAVYRTGRYPRAPLSLCGAHGVPTKLCVSTRNWDVHRVPVGLWGVHSVVGYPHVHTRRPGSPIQRRPGRALLSFLPRAQVPTRAAATAPPLIGRRRAGEAALWAAGRALCGPGGPRRWRRPWRWRWCRTRRGRSATARSGSCTRARPCPGTAAATAARAGWRCWAASTCWGPSSARATSTSGSSRGRYRRGGRARAASARGTATGLAGGLRAPCRM